MANLTFEIEKDFQFEAAHFFGHADANDLFKKIHGHSFAGTVRIEGDAQEEKGWISCLLYTSPSPRDLSTSRMPSSA